MANHKCNQQKTQKEINDNNQIIQNQTVEMKSLTDKVFDLTNKNQSLNNELKKLRKIVDIYENMTKLKIMPIDDTSDVQSFSGGNSKSVINPENIIEIGEIVTFEKRSSDNKLY